MSLCDNSQYENGDKLQFESNSLSHSKTKERSPDDFAENSDLKKQINENDAESVDGNEDLESSGRKKTIREGEEESHRSSSDRSLSRSRSKERKSRSNSRGDRKNTRRHSRSRSREAPRSHSRSRSPSREHERSHSRSRSRSRRRRRSHSRSERRRSRSRRGSRSRRSRSRTPSEGSRLHIAEIDVDTRKRDLERTFEKYGRLREVWMARNPPCFAFVVFKHRRDAEEALRDTDGMFIGRCRIKVTHARPRVRGGRFRGFDLNLRCYQCGEAGHFSRNCTDTKFGYKRPQTPPRNCCVMVWLCDVMVLFVVI